MILHMGEIDIPYANDAQTGPRPKKLKVGTQTTGDVAEFLENKYHVIRNFWELHQEENMADLEAGLQSSIESLAMGAPPTIDAFAEGLGKLEDRFKQFLSSGEMEHIGYPGVPTKAALDRRSNRFKSKRGPSQRPSFVDTGLYAASFKAWLD